jgi:serine/threonine protein kinase
VDGRSDLYSLGVMLFQMLAGVLPFRGDSMAELMYKIANEEAPDIRIIRPELPESLANLVALSVSKRPETRYQDGDQFAADLRSVLAALPAEMLSGGAPQTASSSMQAVGGASEKTAVMSAASSAGANFEKTVVHGIAGRGAAPAAVGQDRANEKTTVLSAAPANTPTFDKTVVHDHAAAGKATGAGTDIEI